LGYYKDEFIKYFVHTDSWRKDPLMNRGTLSSYPWYCRSEPVLREKRKKKKTVKQDEGASNFSSFRVLFEGSGDLEANHTVHRCLCSFACADCAARGRI
jgi:hypothetical protein